MRRIAVAAFVAAAMFLPMQAASADESTSMTADELRDVDGLSADQVAAIDSYVSSKDARVSERAAPALRGAQSLAALASRRATYYRGSWLMWTRDNVDFGYDWSRVTWTSPYQEAGYVFPNIARNLGISKYYDTTRNDRFRARNRIGAGIVTPWGDVQVYSSDFTHRLSVHHNGAWSAWSD